MTKNIYQHIITQKKDGKPQLAVLIDPDKTQHLPQILMQCKSLKPTYFFVGGSLVSSDNLEDLILKIKAETDVPVVLFPGSLAQISAAADGILLLSLISGRNPELLIGNHVLAAHTLKKSALEILPTGYMLIDGGKPTTVSYISNTQPIPANKPEIAAATALAGEMLGLKIIYLDAGSGAENAVSVEMVAAVRSQTTLPIVVGGGITTPAHAQKIYNAGADVVVIGNVFEKKPELMQAFAAILR